MRIIFLLFLTLSNVTIHAGESPANWILTYNDDPFTSITVNWQCFTDEPSEAFVFYDTQSGNGNPANFNGLANAEVSRIPGLDKRWIYRATIRNLDPGTTYFLMMGEAEGPVSKEIKFKTLGGEGNPDLRFVTGGDMDIDYKSRRLMALAAAENPDLAMVGGDIAYANGRLDAVDKWDTWLNYYSEEMVTPDGYTIPAIFAIGNHEVDGGFGKTKAEAPFFFGFFGQDADKTYFTRRLARDAVIFVLDSGHVASHKEQADWLKETFPEFDDVAFKAAIYHVPLYPSHRDYLGKYSDLGRKHWLPVFDEFGLTVAFENHDHTFKRSYHLQDNEVVEATKGTLFLGDGCWGRTARSVDYDKRWYLNTVGSIEHFWLVEVEGGEASYRAIDLDGQVFDVYPETLPDSGDATEVMAAKTVKVKFPWHALEIADLERSAENPSTYATTVTVTNPFPDPLRFFLEKRPQGTGIPTPELPGGTLIAPGETKQFKLSFGSSDTSSDSPTPSFGINVRMEMLSSASSQRMIMQHHIDLD